MKIKNIDIRIFVYLGCLLIVIVLIIFKQDSIRRQRNKQIISTISCWDKMGKPVVVRPISACNIKVFTKFTIKPIAENLFAGYVTAQIKNKLKVNQLVYIENKENKIWGRISKINNEIDRDSGMFYVFVEFNQPVDWQGAIFIAYAHTDTLEKVIRIYPEDISIEGGQSLVWKILNGQAKKQEIIFEDIGSNGLIVRQGLGEGDLLVINGQTQLFEADKVKILTTNPDI